MINDQCLMISGSWLVVS